MECASSGFEDFLSGNYQQDDEEPSLCSLCYIGTNNLQNSPTLADQSIANLDFSHQINFFDLKFQLTEQAWRHRYAPRAPPRA